ncbi:MAG: hypothetical protein WBW71_15705, partial [Bacteroidota bacterium]
SNPAAVAPNFFKNIRLEEFFSEPLLPLSVITTPGQPEIGLKSSETAVEEKLISIENSTIIVPAEIDVLSEIHHQSY